MQVRLVALVPVLGLLLAGCSEEKPKALPVPTAVSPIASPSPSAAGVPSEAVGETPQAAAAFVRYYYEQLGQALVSLDSSKIKPLFTSSCKTCATSVKNIDAERSKARRYSGGGITVRSAEGIALDAKRTAVTTVYDSNPLIRETGPGAPSPLPSRDGITVEVQVVRSGSSWLVDRILAV
ncbi:MAG: hypothetical protein JWO60_3 [Frankiales bacterium]|nr:hypothetical protein [Frankiales bacterium]